LSAWRSPASAGTGRPRQNRRLRLEPLETRQLLAADVWHPFVPLGTAEAEDCADDSSDTGACTPGGGTSGGDTSGASQTGPLVDVVDVSPASPRSIGISFDRAMNLDTLLDEGGILEAVALTRLDGGAVNLDPESFLYDTGTRTLIVRLPDALPAGDYELRLDGERITDADGNGLHGGSGGLATGTPSFAAAVNVQAGGEDLRVDSYSVPSLADFDGDGVADLLVGEKTAAGEGKVRVYVNHGSAQTPEFDEFAYARTADGDLVVAGSGCQGVFPRLFDWNRDGLNDLVLGLAGGAVQVALNEADGADPVFAAPVAVQFGPLDSKADLDFGSRATLDLVDYDGDGRFDLVLGDMDGSVRVLLNRTDAGPAEFGEAVLLADGGEPLSVPTGRSSVVIADLNQDGRRDLIAGNTEGQILFYRNVGTDAEPQFDGHLVVQAGGNDLDLPDFPRSRPAVVDLNNDGTLDLLVGAGDGLVRFYAGQPLSAPSGLAHAEIGASGTRYVHGLQLPDTGDDPWQQTQAFLDINGDGYVTPLDLLIVLNHLYANGWSAVPSSPAPPVAWACMDCTGDGNVTALDAWRLIDDLNAHGPYLVGSQAEGESSASRFVDIPRRGGLADGDQPSLFDQLGDEKDGP